MISKAYKYAHFIC